MENIVIAGESGQAKVVIDIVEQEGKYRIVGLIDKNVPIGTPLLGYEVIGRDEDLPSLINKHSIKGAIVAIGDNWRRYQVAEKLKHIAPKLVFVSAIHASAQLARDVEIGIGTVIMPGVIINSSCKIGKFCILNTIVSIDHDSKMADFSSLAPNATIGGNVSIGAFTAVLLGANVIHGTKIGKHTIIGAGATVLEDIPSNVVAYGTPAKVMKNRNKGDKYL